MSPTRSASSALLLTLPLVLIACPQAPTETTETTETTSGTTTGETEATTEATFGTSEATETTTATETETETETGDPGPFRLSFVELTTAPPLHLLTDFVFIPDTEPPELLITSLDGTLSHYRSDGATLTRLGAFTVPEVHMELDCGLIALTLDPEFASNGLVYVGLCTALEELAIHRLTFDAANYAAIPETAAEILQVTEPLAPRPWHNVGSLSFDGDGFLWALLGDKLVLENGQNLGNNFGSLIRILPNREADGSGYEPAPGNPFAEIEGASPDIYAYGLRSPWRGFLDHHGRYWIGDVGRSDHEEVNLVASGGENFAWPVHEGPCSGQCGGFTDPIVSYDHELDHPYTLDDEDVTASTLRAVWIGPEYHQPSVDRYAGHLDDRLLFGDFCAGFVRALAVDDAGTVLEDIHVGHLANPVAWRIGADGFFYAATFGSCTTQTLNPDALPESRLFRVESVGSNHP